MERIIIYGASESGQKILNELRLTPHPVGSECPYDVIAFADGKKELQGREVSGVKVISPADIPNYSYDRIAIAALMTKAKEEIIDTLVNDLKVDQSKIDVEYIDSFTRARYRFLLDQSELIHTLSIEGSVAEVGVWRGDYAKYINAFFPDRNLYLFDTFDWYDCRDISTDVEKGIVGTLLSNKDIFKDTSVDIVKAALPHPEKAIFKVGYFPDSAQGINETFAFVNIDVNLYTSTLAALDYFYPKMNKGGVILCHDYFSWDVDPGSSLAIKEFCSKIGVPFMAIGDRLSVAIIKQ